MADFEEAGDHDVFKKIRKDFDGKTSRCPIWTSAAPWTS